MMPRRLRSWLRAAALFALAALAPGAASAISPGQDVVVPAPAPDAYFDETARHLVLGMRAERDATIHGIDAYTALLRERMSLDMPFRERTRPLVSGEFASRVRWSRNEPTVVHVLGARMREPDYVPERGARYDRSPQAARFGLNPLADPFTFGGLAARNSPFNVVRSPLSAEAERYYQYESGDTMTVRLPDGRSIRIVEVKAIPRRRSVGLVKGILWIDPDTFGLARAAWRLAKRADSEIELRLREDGRWNPALRFNVPDLETDDAARMGPFDRLTNWVADGLIGNVAMDVTTVVVDYQLYELRHWLPRAVRWEGYLGSADEVVPPMTVSPVAPLTFDWTIEIEDVRERGAAADAGSPASAAEALASWRQDGDSVSGNVEATDPDEVVLIEHGTSGTRAEGDLLPAPVSSGGFGGVANATVADAASTLAAIGPSGSGIPGDWTLHPPVKTLWLLRWSAYERLSVGARLDRNFDWGRASVTARFGTRSLEAPDVYGELIRRWPRARVHASAFRSLRGSGAGSGDLGSVVYATGTDLEDYYWAEGGALRLLPGLRARSWLSLGVFAERQKPALTQTVHARYGAIATWRPWWGGATWESLGAGVALDGRAVGGDGRHVKATATAAASIPLGGDVSFGVEGGGAGIWGEPLRHDLWRLGGTGRWLRGHSGVRRTRAVWRGRADLQRPGRFGRLSVFADWGAADGQHFYAAGVGLAIFSEMMRLDVAHGFGARAGETPAESELRPSRLTFHVLAGSFF